MTTYTTYTVKRLGQPITFSSELTDEEALAFCGRSGQQFGKDLAAQAREKGVLSLAQTAWAHKIGNDQKRRESAKVDSKRVNLGKLVRFMDEAASGGSRVAVIVRGYRLSIAGSKARYPGSITVTTGERDYASRQWLGRIYTDGTCEIHDEDALSALCAIACDPAGAVAAHGRLTGWCACCSRALRDPASVSRGYGPTCAKRFGLALTPEPRKERG